MSDNLDHSLNYFCDEYVEKGPPFVGKSHYRDKDLLKEKGARWKPDVSMFVAPSEEVAIRLISTLKWSPPNIPASYNNYLISCLKRNIAQQMPPPTVPKNKSSEEQKKEHNNNKKQKKSHIITTVTEKTSGTSSNSKSTATATATVTEKQQQHQHGLIRPDNEPHLLEELRGKGISEEMANATYTWPRLGPMSGISNAERTLRGLRLRIVTVEQVIRGEE